MSLFLITGLPGTGKSTAKQGLIKRGYEAYDADEDHLAYWFDSSGRPVARDQEERTPEFVANHTRGIARKTVEELAAKAKDKIIFLCGDPDNEEELHDLFEKCFALVVDENTRSQRLASRTNNTWGKLPHEIEYSLKFQKTAAERYHKFSYTCIDSSQPAEVVTSKIISLIA